MTRSDSPTHQAQKNYLHIQNPTSKTSLGKPRAKRNRIDQHQHQLGKVKGVENVHEVLEKGKGREKVIVAVVYI